MGMTFQSFFNFKDDCVLLSLHSIIFLFWIENFQRPSVEEKVSFVFYRICEFLKSVV